MFKSFIIPCFGEIKKMQINYQKSKANTLSLLFWPIITFALTYYTYSSFNIENLLFYEIHNKKEFLIFLIAGALGYNCFWAMVQGAFMMTRERQDGTLEIVFLSPTNRLSIMYGRALGGVISNVWLFASFSVFIILINSEINLMTLFKMILAFIMLLIASTIWGGLINSLFLTSRDASFLFTLCDEPMKFFSGVQLPIQSFPLWAKWISSIFPATYCIWIIRAIFLGSSITPYMVFLFILSLLLMVVLSIIILKKAEEHNKKTGNLQLY